MPSPQKIMPEDDKKYRLITRSDMDGLVCGVLLKELGIINEITFAHPKDMQDNIVRVGDRDIITNLPFIEGAYMGFDHHASEVARRNTITDNHVIDPDAPSAARVVYDYFGGESAFPNVSKDMMEAVDRADSAQFSESDVLNAQGWDLLSFLMDSRTGLGRFRDFEISNYQLMMRLIDHCRKHSDINEILELPDVKERATLYREHQEAAKEQLQRCADVQGNLVVLDLRNEDTIWATNRFMIYALFPQVNISMHVLWGRNKQNTVFAIGKSILNRTSKTNVGDLCLFHGGGGHEAAGTCQVENLRADEAMQELIEGIIADG